MKKVLCLVYIAAIVTVRGLGAAQNEPAPAGPDPKEIPIPEIKTELGLMPGVKDLPVREVLPDPMVMNDGTRVAKSEQWKRRRAEMRRILQYYAVGAIPPSPGNVKGREVTNETVLDGTVKYRLVHLTFGPGEKLFLDIGIFTRAQGGPFPAIIYQTATPPGAESLPRLAQGPNQGRGQDVLLLVGPGSQSTNSTSAAPGTKGGRPAARQRCHPAEYPGDGSRRSVAFYE